MVICQTICVARFSQDGKYLELEVLELRQYTILPLGKETGLPEIPKGGFSAQTGANELAKGVMVKTPMDSVVSPEKYSYAKVNIRRNIFRVPIG